MLKKEKVIYKRQYADSKFDEYSNLIAIIKENSIDDIKCQNGDTLKTKYFIFDGTFLARVTFNLSSTYDKKNWNTEAIVEKMGKNTIDKSDIEKLLTEHGFKKEED